MMPPLSYDPNEPAYPQTADWTCSACSLSWLNRALSIEHATDEWSAVEYIGNPQHINSTYGLMDGSGARLVECLREQGAPAFTAWLDWETTYGLSQAWPLLVGGVGLYHWMGVRVADDGVLWIANSACGYGGVYNTLGQDQWDHYGPWAVISVPLLHSVPDIDVSELGTLPC
jgi:hypothetical protein